VQNILAVECHGPGLDDGLRRQQPQNREGGDGFAGTGFADQGQHAASGKVQRHLIHHRRLAGAETDAQVADLQPAHCRYFLGSKASRTASPIKISSDRISASDTNALMPSQGACRLALPWPSSSPSDGEPGGRPKPMKSSVVRVTMAPLRMNGRKVRVATIALGSMCRNMITGADTPSARAART